VQCLGSKVLHLALSGDYLYVTYTTEFPVGDPDTRVIRTTPPHIVRMNEVLQYI
jgi:hypothetical protein